MIKEINCTAEISLEELLEYKNQNQNIQFIVVNNNKQANNKHSYTLDEMIKIKSRINSIIGNVKDKFDEPDKQKKVFTYLYTKLASFIEYDELAASTVGLGGYDRDRSEDIREKASNLIGGLLNGKSMCGGYSEILRNVLSEVGIESICISGVGKDGKGKHAWNQVKLDGKWYNADLTNDRDPIVEGKECIYFLKSNSDFQRYEQYDIESLELRDCTESVTTPSELIADCKFRPQDSAKTFANASTDAKISTSELSPIKKFFMGLLKNKHQEQSK